MARGATGFGPVHAPRTIHEATVAQVRAWIQDGTLRPGQRLHQDQLAARLGVSRMPVREAIRRLAAEGFVEIEPHRGAFVAALDPAEIRELYLIRAALETLAAGLAVERIGEAEIDRLRGLLDAMREAVAAGDDERAIDLDRELHACLFEPAGMPLLLGLIAQMRDRSAVFRRAHAHIPGRADVSNREHAALLDAVVARDRGALERLTHEHLINAADHLIAHVAPEGALTSRRAEPVEA